MARLEELTPGPSVRGIIPDKAVTVISVKWFGANVIELTYKGIEGKLGNQLVYRDNESMLEIAAGEALELRWRRGAFSAWPASWEMYAAFTSPYGCASYWERGGLPAFDGATERRPL